MLTVWYLALQNADDIHTVDIHTVLVLLFYCQSVGSRILSPSCLSAA